MSSNIKRIIDRAIWPITVFRKMVLRKNSYLHTTGWIYSVKKGCPCKEDGTEIPWMNYAIVRFLEERLKKSIHLFEYGSGYSTAFYANLVADVTSVEYDQKWFYFIKNKMPNNARIIYKDKDVDGGYCRAISETGKKYDIVIVDGRDRVNCVMQSINCLSEQGVIILDDSHREKYKQAINYSKEKGFRAISLEGLKAPSYKAYETTILYRNNNCLGI